MESSCCHLVHVLPGRSSLVRYLILDDFVLQGAVERVAEHVHFLPPRLRHRLNRHVLRAPIHRTRRVPQDNTKARVLSEPSQLQIWSHCALTRPVTSGRSSDQGLGSKMDFVILIVWLTTWGCQDLLLSEQAILLDHGVVDTTAIHTTPTGRPHLSI